MTEEKKLDPSMDIREIAKDRCGAGMFQTDKDDPFFAACQIHDEIFQARHDAKADGKKEDPALNVSLSDANNALYNTMDYIATQQDSMYLHAKKWLYYGFVTTLGWIWWK